MRPKSGRVSFITHVSDDEILIRMLMVERGLKEAILHHARPEPIADKHDVIVFGNGQFFRRLSERGE